MRIQNLLKINRKFERLDQIKMLKKIEDHDINIVILGKIKFFKRLQEKTPIYDSNAITELIDSDLITKCYLHTFTYIFLTI